MSDPKPCGVLNAEGFFDPLLAFMEPMIHEGFVRPVPTRCSP